MLNSHENSNGAKGEMDSKQPISSRRFTASWAPQINADCKGRVPQNAQN